MKALPLLTLLMAAPALQEAEKTYELSFKYRPSPGQRIDILQEDDESRTITITYDDPGEPPVVDVKKRGHSFAAECEVLRWRSRRDTELLWRFSKALRMRDGKVLGAGLLDRRFRYRVDPKTGCELSVETGPRMGAAEEAALNEVVENAFGELRARVHADLVTDPDFSLFPTERIRVGQTWKSNPEKLAQAFLSGMELDPAKSEAALTLKSVASRGGGEIARVEGTITLVIMGYGPMKFDTGLALKTTFSFEGCLDGGSVDNEIRLTIECADSSRFRAEGKAPCRVAVDLKRVILRSRKSKP